MLIFLFYLIKKMDEYIILGSTEELIVKFTIIKPI
jgi:hypothetical protein